MTRFLTLLWLTFVATLSLMPLRLKFRVGTIGVFHNLGHVVVFFITSVLVCRAIRTLNGRLVGLAGVCLFGLVLEILEVLTYHCSFEWRDVLVDILGAGVGLFAVTFLPSSVPYKGPAGQRNML